MQSLLKDIEASGRYKVLKEIGSGGMAKVLLAFDTHLNCNVALKILSFYPDSSRQDQIKALFINEAQTLAKLNHANVVRIFDLNTSLSAPFISMEYLEGHNLRQFLKKNPGLAYGERLKIFQEICEGVKAIHQLGVIHRDLKPENILVTLSGQVKVMDFGIVDDLSGQKNDTFGTPAYISPEQMSGSQIDVRSDIYSLGILGTELFAGRRPSGNSNAFGKLAGLFPPHVPRVLVKMLVSCLSRQASQRPPSLEKICEQLQATPTRENSLLARIRAPLIFSAISATFLGGVMIHKSVKVQSGRTSSREVFSEYYDTLRKCAPDCSHQIDTLTRILSKKYSSMSCGDDRCSFVEKSCGTCATDCKESFEGFSGPRPICLSFSRPPTDSPEALAARRIIDECYFSGNERGLTDRQQFVRALIACTKNADNVMIGKCAEALPEEGLDGRVAITYLKCLFNE